MAETNSRNHINMVDFVILQLFFAFQSVYKKFTSILRWDFWRKQTTPSITESPDDGNNEKRHFIQLYKTEPKEVGEKSVCYMNVIEFDNSGQIDEIRRRKRSYEIFRNVCRRQHSDNDIQRFFCSNFRY